MQYYFVASKRSIEFFTASKNNQYKLQNTLSTWKRKKLNYKQKFIVFIEHIKKQFYMN